MARSRKKPYYKDKGMTTQDYWSAIRREWKQHLHKYADDPDLAFRNPKEIVNDYTYSDYRFFLGNTKENAEKYSRK